MNVIDIQTAAYNVNVVELRDVLHELSITVALSTFAISFSILWAAANICNALTGNKK